jgi:hypothetical protein
VAITERSSALNTKRLFDGFLVMSDLRPANFRFVVRKPGKTCYGTRKDPVHADAATGSASRLMRPIINTQGEKRPQLRDDSSIGPNAELVSNCVS